ncbi:MAG: UDP-N-acetylglucosamine 2-epimerase (non-hydrolyzing) [Firmicutes bacterium]|nr:UDP-N-acetylglucosamine 2-epimerase (non-hydrolyzing) [Bacillota bacterium]
MKLMTVVGARPQFIKVSALSRILRSCDGIEERLVHTGQHYDDKMSDVFFRELEMPQPDYYLGIGSASHGAQTGRMLEAIETVLLEERPDAVLVYGDTNSTLAGALSAVKLHIPVAHVEAGLRSFNRAMPEEINRILTDHASSLLFAPTQTSVKNLLQEGISEAMIHLVGDVMYDAALYYGQRTEEISTVLHRLRISPHSYVLATIHRAENTDDSNRLQAIFEGLRMVTRQFPVVVPLHPRTRKALETHRLLNSVMDELIVIDPVGYLDMIHLERNACVIATDSGGVQKEAYFHRVPCVTLRDETEWMELVHSGWNQLVSPICANDVQRAILAAVGRRGTDVSLYGDGKAAERIADVLIGEFC